MTSDDSSLVLHNTEVGRSRIQCCVDDKTVWLARVLMAESADAAQPNMGLATWRSGVVRKGDVTIAKNYLRENEVEELNRLVVVFLDFAEDRAKRRKQIFLQRWVTPVHDSQRFDERATRPAGGTLGRARKLCTVTDLRAVQLAMPRHLYCQVPHQLAA
jgi:hypothetical protein